MSKSIIVKYKGLEILCQPGTVVPYRQGKLSMSNVVITDDAIYKDVKKGNIASDKDIEKAFGESLSLKDALDIMLHKGDFQLTIKEREDLNEQRRLRLLDYFQHQYVNPETNTPHPITRLEATFKQIKAKVNYEMPFNKNCDEIHKAMLGVLPIKPKELASGAVEHPKTQKPKNSNVKDSYDRKKGDKSLFNPKK
jgi:ribosome maturation protein SDO1